MGSLFISKDPLHPMEYLYLWNSRGGIMDKNAGTFDRIVRVVIGIILLYAVAAGMVHGIVMYVAGILGLMMLVTAALAYCPLYPALKIDTTCTTCKPK